MKALGCSHLTFLTGKQREKDRAVWCSREIGQSRQETCFLVHEKRVRNGSSLAVSFQQKRIRSIPASSSAQVYCWVRVPLVHSFAGLLLVHILRFTTRLVKESLIQTNDHGEEIQKMHSDQRKNIRVRFKLQKDCGFGQQFLIVGDDPILGLWDPSDGVPLIWSEGHLWTAEMDIPGGKGIKYKFILKGDSENITWQPGPDRILVTWYTDKTLTIFEDWDNPELQNIVEEEIASDVKVESLIDSDYLIVIKNLIRTISDKETDAINELANANGHKDVVEKPFAENITTEELRGEDLSSSGKGSHTLDDEGMERKSGDILDEGVISVLVPGLVTTPPSGETEEAGLLEQVENETVERKIIDGIEDSTETKETNETMMIHQKQQINGADCSLETDLHWGRQTLQKFLASFGFQ